MENTEIATSDVTSGSELRIVLLGYGISGKSSAGNTILGKEEFDLTKTGQCVKREGDMAGRQVTVVDTPGWWRKCSIEKTPQLVKQEILSSVSLCPPGPHTFLLVIAGGYSFPEECRRSIQQHLEPLGESVWSHTILLFTYGDCLGDTTIEQHIESEGKALQWLVEKCGNRYHVFNNKNRGDSTQVTELLEKIEEVVAKNKGHYEVKYRLYKSFNSKEKYEGPRKKPTELMIGTPFNFQHVNHVSWNPNTGFDLNNLDPGLKNLFYMCGISEAQLKDKRTSKVIYDFIENIGRAESVKNELHMENLPPPHIPHSSSPAIPPPSSTSIAPAQPPHLISPTLEASLPLLPPSGGGELQHPELRIVLLGSRETGKSSAGNTILNQQEFELTKTDQCVKRQGDVAGRQVTVVDTPGWRRNKLVEKTPELVKQEILRSVSLCPPGPHTILLVITLVLPFTDKDQRSMEEHLELLSESVWSHTIVLFTYGDCLGAKTIEQHIESEGKALQWLVEKCGNRYHVLNNENRASATQITELLEKIEEVVAGNRGHYKINRKMLETLERKMKGDLMRANQRLMELQKAIVDIRSFWGLFHLSELRIVLLGSKTCGKSSAGNTILNRQEFELTKTDQCVKRQGDVAGRQVTVVDTPGWRRNDPVEKTPELVRQEIVRSVSLCPPGPHTILLVITLVLPFTDKDQRSMEEHLELLGKSVWSHTIVLFTYGDCLGETTIEQHIESEGKALQWLVEKCGNRYHVLNNENRASATQITELLEKIEEVVAGNNEGHYEIDQTDISQTQQQHPQPEFVKNPFNKSVVKKTDGGQRKKLTKEMISNPTNFKHVGHFGWDPELNS